jgi:hypothetical protein
MCRLPVSELGAVERRKTPGFRSAGFGRLADKRRATKFIARKLVLLLFPLGVCGSAFGADATIWRTPAPHFRHAAKTSPFANGSAQKEADGD